MLPGRTCPLSYRHAPAELARQPVLRVDPLYVIGGLYGNRQALEWIEARAGREHGGAALVFNGDFNWFNVDPASFAAVNEAVLRHVALRGNVETEIAGDDPAAGCGCAYPDRVSDEEVERSNRIIERLRETARAPASARCRRVSSRKWAICVSASSTAMPSRSRAGGSRRKRCASPRGAKRPHRGSARRTCACSLPATPACR